MALNFGLLDQGGPTNFFEGYSQGQEKMQANAMAQQRAAQAQQEFGMRQQEFAAGQADKQRVAKAAVVTQKTASARDAILRAPTAADARRIVEMQYADPDLGPIRGRFGSLAQALAEIPEEASAFQQYKEQEAMGMEEFLKLQAGNREFASARSGVPARAAPAPAPTAQAAAVAPTVQASIDDMVSRGIPRETITVEDGKIYVGSYGSNVVGEPPIMEKYFTPEGGFAMRPQAPLTPLRVAANQMAPGSVNAMVPQAPAAPPSELQGLIAERDRLSAISNQTPRVKTNIENLNKDIERLSRTKEKINVIGVAKGTGNPVYLDSISDEQYIYVADADGKQKRKLYSGPVDRSTSNVTATANARLPAQEGAFETGLGKGQSERILANQVVAQDAAAILETNKVGRDLLKSGAITGTGANFLVGFNNALKQAGIDFGYADAASNSQAYAAAMGANVGRIIKQFGAGTGLSDADREYAAQIAGGKIALTEASLRKILDINDRAANRIIDLHNKNVSGIKTNIPLTVEKPVGIAPQPAAASQIPSGAPAAPASNITQQRQDANAAIAKGAPAAAVRQRFKQNTGQEL
jgi:hypothetical protein